MSKGLIKLIVFFVIDLDDSVSDQERVALVFSKLFVAIGNLAGEVSLESKRSIRFRARDSGMLKCGSDV